MFPISGTATSSGNLETNKTGKSSSSYGTWYLWGGVGWQTVNHI